MQFPRVKYHPEHPEGVVVRDPEHEAGLGPGWVDHPHHLPVEILSRQPYWPNDPIDPPPAAAEPSKKRGGKNKGAEGE